MLYYCDVCGKIIGLWVLTVRCAAVLPTPSLLPHCPSSILLCALKSPRCHGSASVTPALEWDVAQAIEHQPVKDTIIRSILHSRCICSLSYFPFQPVVHKWSIKGCGMTCPVCGKVHIKDPLRLIRKSSLCGDSGFSLKKYLTMIICLMSNSR